MKTRYTLLTTSLFLSLGALLMAAAPTPPTPAASQSETPFPTTMGPAAMPRMKLWTTTPNIVAGTDADANPTEPTIDLYLLSSDKTPTGGAAAVLVLPGGGYTNLSMKNEGSDEAKFFNEHNIAAFVLRYRHAPRYHYPIPLIDAQRALRLLRTNAATFHLNPDKIGIMGFSAGGHLAAMTTTMYDNGPKLEAPYVADPIDAASAKPNFALLLYPVIDFSDDTIVHKGSRTALTQNDQTLYEPLSPQKHVTKDTPPIFLVQGTNDRTVPVMNSLVFYEACLKAGVPVEMHILENGPHGFGMGLTQNDPEIKSWPEQAIRWMAKHKFQ